MHDNTLQYQSIVETYHKDIYRYLYWMTRNPQLAEDACQEAFLRVWRFMDKVGEVENLKSWLIRIARNELYRILEKEKSENISIDNVEYQLMTPDTAELEASDSVLHKAVMSLSETYREPLILQVWGGFSGDEIAKLLGIERQAVMTRIFRAKRQLEKLISETNSHVAE